MSNHYIIYNCNPAMNLLIRLKEIIAHYDLTSSTFADEIEVQRSSISHLLSGRNKPSLDFVMKVVKKFPEVDLYWFLYGEGFFPKKEKNNDVDKTKLKKEITTPSLFTENTEFEQEPAKKSNTRFSEGTKKLIKVMLLYSDGSFEEFNK